jgi:hypothetical protein
MAGPQYYLWTEKTPYIERIKKEFSLPLSDRTIFINGNIDISSLADAEIDYLHRLREWGQGRKCLY